MLVINVQQWFQNHSYPTRPAKEETKIASSYNWDFHLPPWKSAVPNFHHNTSVTVPLYLPQNGSFPWYSLYWLHWNHGHENILTSFVPLNVFFQHSGTTECGTRERERNLHLVRRHVGRHGGDPTLFFSLPWGRGRHREKLCCFVFWLHGWFK